MIFLLSIDVFLLRLRHVLKFLMFVIFVKCKSLWCVMTTERTACQSAEEMERGTETWLYDKQAASSYKHSQLVALQYCVFVYQGHVDHSVSFVTARG